MEKNRLRAFAAMAAIGLTLTGGTASAQYEVNFINIGTGTTGGSFYPAGIALSKLISDNLPVRASAMSSAGSVENVGLLKGGEANMAFIQINVAQDAIAGRNAFSDDQFDGMVMLSPMFRSQDHVVVRSSEDINSLADLRGKRVAVGRAGSGTLLTSEALLASAGLSFDDIDPEYIGQGEALDALKNGVIDAAPVSGGIPISALTEALTTAGDELAIYSMTPEEQQAFIETSGWKVSDTLPAGTYPGQDEPITTTAHMALLMVPADFPEDLGRDILHLIYNRIDELRAAHGVYKSVSEEAAKSAIDQLTVPLAAGTKAYFGIE